MIEKLKTMWQKLVTWIKKHKMASLAIAVGVVFLLFKKKIRLA